LSQGQLFGQVLDFYLRPENKKHWHRIQALARQDTASADEEIMKYFMEGSRLNSSVALPRELRKDATVQDGEHTLHLKKGQRVMVNLVAANHDAARYDNVDEVDPDRNIGDYIVYGWGPHTCLGMEMSQVALSTMLKTVAKLDGLRRAPGTEGELKQMHNKDGFATYMTQDGTQIFPFPTSMKVRWNGPIRGVKRKHRHDDDDDDE
jgi:linoleate 8R-lipoxygenase/9,12-octadecadienoate 8-hydroperoxide 8R-isomerase